MNEPETMTSRMIRWALLAIIVIGIVVAVLVTADFRGEREDLMQPTSAGWLA